MSALDRVVCRPEDNRIVYRLHPRAVAVVLTDRLFDAAELIRHAPPAPGHYQQEPKPTRMQTVRLIVDRTFRELPTSAILSALFFFGFTLFGVFLVVARCARRGMDEMIPRCSQ